MLRLLLSSLLSLTLVFGATYYLVDNGGFKLQSILRKNFRDKIKSNAVKTHFNAVRFASGSHIITPSGKTRILTNSHVCVSYTNENAELGISKSVNASQEFVMKKILKFDPEVDLCLVEATQTEGFKIAESLEIGQSTYLLGHPAGSELLLQEGEYVIKKEILVMTEIPIAPGLSFMLPVPFLANHISNIGYGGNSGSAVLNSDGELVGVLFAGSVSVVLQSYMVPLEKVKEFLKGE